jgi:hypothetical protein
VISPARACMRFSDPSAALPAPSLLPLAPSVLPRAPLMLSLAPSMFPPKLCWKQGTVLLPLWLVISAPSPIGLALGGSEFSPPSSLRSSYFLVSSTNISPSRTKMVIANPKFGM